MSILFIDSTYDISLGILDDAMKWSSFRRFIGQRASSTLQKEAHKLLSDFNITPTDLKGIVTVAGPGFYTGLRLSEGFSDVFKFFQIPHYSFYTYSIPAWCGVDKGVWFTKAYRGEYFLHQWENSVFENKLITSSDLEENLSQQALVYIHSNASLDDKSRPLLQKTIETNELLQQFPELIFKRVLTEKLNCESYYFRAPEDEFRVSI